MPKETENLPLEVALRIKELHESSGLTVAEVNRHVGKNSTWLTGLIGPNALLPNARRPMPGVMTIARLADIYCVETDYILCLSDRISPIVQSNPKEFRDIVQRASDDLTRLVQRRCTLGDSRFSVGDVLNWWRETGGEVGRGNDIEQYVDVIEIPEKGANVVKPLALGPHSLASRVLPKPSPASLRQLVERMPQGQRQQIVGEYAEVKERGVFPITDMSVVIPGREEPINYWALRLRGKLLGKSSPSVAISFAFE